MKNVKVGDKVRLKKRVPEYKEGEFAIVRELLYNFADGAIMLESPLGGFRYWNICDLAFA